MNEFTNLIQIGENWRGTNVKKGLPPFPCKVKYPLVVAGRQQEECNDTRITTGPGEWHE